MFCIICRENSALDVKNYDKNVLSFFFFVGLYFHMREEFTQTLLAYTLAIFRQSDKVLSIFFPSLVTIQTL